MFSHYDNKQPWRGGVYLCTAESSFQADLLESKLRGEGIPCVKKYQAAGNFIEIAMGSNNAYPIDLYVPEEMLQAARETIVPVPIEDDFEEAEE